jgi:hypothetical protein
METPSHKFIYEWRYSAISAGMVIVILLAGLNYLAGTWDPVNAPWYFESGRAFIGMTLLVTLFPPYLCVCTIYGFRRSYALARKIDATHNTHLTQTVISMPWKLVLSAGILGALFAIFFNIPSQGWLNFTLDTPADIGIALGQLLIWTVIFCFIAIRLRIARDFNHASQNVPIDIFEPSSLRPFAQIGLIDVLIFAGGMVLSTVQSVDFSFRPDNYYKALSIALPAMLYLAVFPMWHIHKRMLALKKEEQDELNRKIASASKSLEVDKVNELEILLQRRERVANCSTWPIDTAILQRFLFYIIIPPLAWVGAALVESVIDGFIGG